MCRTQAGECHAAKVQVLTTPEEERSFRREVELQTAFAPKAPRVYTHCVDSVGDVKLGTVVMEVMLANNLAVLDEDRAAQFKSDVLGRPLKLPPRSGPVDVDEIQAFQNLLRVEMENFLRKVSERETNLRDLMARGD